RVFHVTGVQTCALPISLRSAGPDTGQTVETPFDRSKKSREQIPLSGIDAGHVGTQQITTPGQRDRIKDISNQIGHDCLLTSDLRSEERRVGKNGYSGG